MLVGLDHGDDAAVDGWTRRTGIVATADFFTPVVDDPYDWGRIAATNALSDVYAMGGTPLVARESALLAPGRAADGGAREVCAAATTSPGKPGATSPAGTASTTRGRSTGWPSPAWVRPEELITLDAGRPGLPLSLTKPLGVGVLNTAHKSTGERFPQAVAAMTTSTAMRPGRRSAPGCAAGPTSTGFGLLGHCRNCARASGVDGCRGHRRGAVPAGGAGGGGATGSSVAAAGATSTG